MSSVPHPLPSRMNHNVAALFGHTDDTLIAWQQACAHAADALRPQPDPERLAKALALAQEGAVALEDDGAAQVTSGGTRYRVEADGTCHCPDVQHRGAPCKHTLAVQIHQQATARLAPSASAAAPPAATPPQPSQSLPPGPPPQRRPLGRERGPGQLLPATPRRRSRNHVHHAGRERRRADQPRAAPGAMGPGCPRPGAGAASPARHPPPAARGRAAGPSRCPTAAPRPRHPPTCRPLIQQAVQQALARTPQP